MNFWDTSALAALGLGESHADILEPILEEDGNLSLWWGTHVEYASAVSRREREGGREAEQAATCIHQFNALARSCQEVPPVNKVRRLAQRMVRVHALKASDALQLAAALVVAEDDPSSIGFVCIDVRLNNAAAREGFRVLPQRR